MDKSFYSIKEFAAIVRVHPKTIWRAIKAGKISAFRLGQGRRCEYRIAASEIDRLAEINLKSVVDDLVDKKIREKQ